MIDWKNITLKELAGYVSEGLRQRGIETILVGGLVLQFTLKTVTSLTIWIM